MKALAVLIIVVSLSIPIGQATSFAVEDYTSTINVFRGSPTVQAFFDTSYGYAVFPVIGKGGFVIGGAYGTGQVYRDSKVTGTARVFEGSIGFQAGGLAFSEIIFFQDERAYTEFISGNFEFDATAQAVAITAGVVAQAGTAGTSAGASTSPTSGVQAQTGYVKGYATFVHAQGGLMYEFSVGGQKFTFTPIF